MTFRWRTFVELLSLQALEKYCRRKYGFSGLTDVMLERRDQDGHFLVDGQQQSFFLAETLK